MFKTDPFLTMIIPAYNEENRLPATLYTIMDYLRQQSYSSEVIVVENGSTDKTSEAVSKFAAFHLQKDDPVEIYLLHSSKGKGAAIKCGMLSGRGQYLFICDADLSMPIQELSKFLPPLLTIPQYGIIIASREIAGAKRYNEPFHRHLMGRVFNLIVQLLVLPGIKDSQCGFKCFSKDAAQIIFPMQSINGWGFDVEVLFIARHLKIQQFEIPITWYYQAESRINPIRDTVNMLKDLLMIRHNFRLGIYNQSIQRNIWIPQQ